MTFWSCRKNNLIRTIRLVLKLMLQPGWQTVAIHILLNISRIKANQTIRFCQLVEHNKRNILLQKSCRKWGRETDPRPLLYIKKAFYKVKASKWSAAWFHYISIALKLEYNKNKLYKTLRLLIQRNTQFWFFRKGSGNSFSTTFFVWFFKKNVSHVMFY